MTISYHNNQKVYATMVSFWGKSLNVKSKMTSSLFKNQKVRYRKVKAKMTGLWPKNHYQNEFSAQK